MLCSGCDVGVSSMSYEQRVRKKDSTAVIQAGVFVCHDTHGVLVVVVV